MSMELSYRVPVAIWCWSPLLGLALRVVLRLAFRLVLRLVLQHRHSSSLALLRSWLVPFASRFRGNCRVFLLHFGSPFLCGLVHLRRRDVRCPRRRPFCKYEGTTTR